MAAVAIIVVVLAAIWARAEVRLRRTLEDLRRRLAALGEGRAVLPVLSRPGGSLGRLAQVLAEVAPRLEARIAHLEQDRRQLSAVLGGMAEGVIAVDSRRRLLFANASADRLFGTGPRSVGRLVSELIRSPQVQQAVETTLAGSEPYRGEITMLSHEPGQRSLARTLSVLGTPLPGAPADAALLVFHDVTELRRLERMRQDFVANVSHELKTPLASIKAYTETLLDWAIHDETVNLRFLHRIEEQAERLNQLILDLLALARIESSQEVYDHTPLELAPLIRKCADLHRPRAEAKHQTLVVDLDQLDPATRVLADEEAIRQIFDNLIDNAIKYTPDHGSVRIQGRLEPDGEQIALEVVDTGIGIPRGDLPRVFERFYRVDKARSRELGGTGLGLSIVKHLVQSIHGQVLVESRPGEGSKFTLLIPRCPAPAARD